MKAKANIKKIALAITLGFSLFATGHNVIHANSAFVYYPNSSEGTANFYEYSPYNQYEINTKVGYITDIQLRPNETVQKIATGNSVQWLVDTDTVSNTQHVYIKPITSNIKTNLIINTNQRSYRLIVNAGDEMEYVVAWKYPKEDYEDKLKHEALELQKMQAENERIEKLANQVYNKDYEVTQNKNVKQSFIPKNIFDNGDKTYIELSKETQDNMPIIYYFDEWDKKKLQLVNYRLKGKFLEIDKIMNNMKLVFSQKSYLVIQRKHVDNTVPAPNTIDISHSVDPLELNKAFSEQAQDVPIQNGYVSIKERLRQLRMQEAKDFIKETNQQQQLSDENLDTMINKLESEISEVDPSTQEQQKPEEGSPAVAKFIAENYK